MLKMVIEKVHGLNATTISLNERFTLLQSTRPQWSRQRQFSLDALVSPHNKLLIEKIARRMEMQAKRKALMQQHNLPAGRVRRNSEGSNTNPSQNFGFVNMYQNFKNKNNSWRSSNSNLSRAGSVSSLPSLGSAIRRNRRWIHWGRGQNRGVVQNRLGISRRGNIAARLGGPQSMGRGHQNEAGTPRASRGRGMRRGRGQARERGKGRAGVTKDEKTVPTKEELDDQLDRYMACSRFVLDKQLDEYINNPMDLE